MGRHQDFIWTEHARQRAWRRGLSDDEVWLALRRPDKSRYATSKRAFEFVKQVGQKEISVVAKKGEQGRWLILSTWSKEGKTLAPKPFFLEKLIQNLLLKLEPKIVKKRKK